MKVYIRKCPVCDTDFIYKNRSSFYSAKKYNKKCLKCSIIHRKKRIFSDKEKEQAKLQLLKVTNKKPVYEIWLEKYGKEIADQKLLNFKEKTSVNTFGKNNPMYGKPSPQGSGNGWSGWYKNWYFRSLRELSFMINVIEAQKLQWELPDKKFKIPYKDYQGKQRIYYPDFIINNNRLVEIKPIKLHNSPKVLAKKLAAEEYCKSLSISYELIDPPILNEEEIKKLYLNRSIKFIDRYEKKFIERYLQCQ